MLIKNSRIVGEKGEATGDIRVESGVIAELGPSLSPKGGEKVIDASGMLALPGGVDVHTHMDLDLGDVRATDDFYTGTAAAACGGTTTIVDHMAFGPRGCSILRQLDAYHRLAEGRAVIDYGFHGVTDHVDGDILAELGTLIAEGVTSHKIYLTYGGKVSDSEALKLLERASELGVMIAVHAENDGAIAHLREKYLAAGMTAPIYHARSRPPECEAEAVWRMAMLARMANDAPLYIVHLSCALALEAVRSARREGQRNLFAETCPQYLLLNEERYLKPDGLKYIMSPPLRTERDSALLWEGILDGDVNVVATDHCPFFYGGEKQLGRGDFSKAPGGAPGVEARIPLMLSQALEGRVTLGRLVSLCCAEPARLFGLYPKKGVLAKGSDADIVIADPEKKVTLSRSVLHENTDYTPYEGISVTGWPVMTISRGEIIARNGAFVGKKGRGRFLKRGLPDLEGRS